MTLSELQADWPDGAVMEWTTPGEKEWYRVAYPDVATPSEDAASWVAAGAWYDSDDPETWGPVEVEWQVIDAEGVWLCGGTVTVDEPGLTRPEEGA
jgi:hypothetical protein